MTSLWFIAALAAPLQLSDVQQGLDGRVPALAAAQAELQAARAELIAARGAFDPVLSGESASYTGKNARASADLSLQATSLFGPSIEAGYRVGAGDFPGYDGRKTAAAGEVRLGVEVPLLRGLGLSSERADRMQAQVGLQGEGAMRDARTQAVRRATEQAWWQWVAAGARLEVAEQQLALALTRNEALAAEVSGGARAAMDQLDNERALFGRRADLVVAEQELAVAALELSLWHRDEAGTPIVPGREQLPGLEAPRLAEVDVAMALARPDLQALRASAEQAGIRRAVASNAQLPELQAKVATRQDLTDEPQEWVVGAKLELPLALREGRGERAKAVAMESAVLARVEGAEDRVAAELAAALERREAASQRGEWAARSAVRARELLVLERRSWELGASNLFVLVQREDALASAAKHQIDAELAVALADLSVRAAAGALTE